MTDGNSPCVLVVNLGSPSSLEISDIKKYLKEFLSDDDVIDLPKVLQQLILRGFILPYRPKRTKLFYEQIWTAEGSPLITNTHCLASALQDRTGWRVYTAMRYQQPSIEDVLNTISRDGYKEVVVVPLYPHNAAATVGSTRKKVESIIRKKFSGLSVSFVDPFFDNDNYITALANCIQKHLPECIDMLLFSYHGLPVRQLQKADVTSSHCVVTPECCSIECESSRACYRANAIKTARLTAERIGIPSDKWQISFQSRVSAVGPRWMDPSTANTLEMLPQAGKKNVAILCPSFICDCLETLWEIDSEGREIFERAGGESFTYIPCLNSSSDFVEGLQSIISESYYSIQSNQMDVM